MKQLGIFVLDTTTGTPAEGIAVALYRLGIEPEQTAIARGITARDGSIANFLPEDSVLPPGRYRLVYETGDYFASSGTPTLFPEISVSFVVSDERRYVLPLLLAPHGYTVYRGS